MKCEKCKCEVRHGVNGYVNEPAPWAPKAPKTALCYGCENDQLIAHEQELVLQSAVAAARAGRFDCI